MHLNIRIFNIVENLFMKEFTVVFPNACVTDLNSSKGKIAQASA
jgi:hypothetical protein